MKTRIFSVWGVALCVTMSAGSLLPGCGGGAPEGGDSTTPSDGAKTAPAGGDAPDKAGKTANADTKNYTSSPQGLQGKLKENYVDFSFDYPKTWVVKEQGQGKDAKNFVKVEREINDKVKGSFTQENFAVGYFSGTGNATSDMALMPKLASQLSSQFAAGFPKYKKVSEGATQIGDYKAHEFRFESKFDKTPRGPVTIWGRTVLISNPKAGDRKGVALIMLATNLAPEIKSAKDVGEKGQMPVILESFKIGKEGASPTEPAGEEPAKSDTP